MLGVAGQMGALGCHKLRTLALRRNALLRRDRRPTVAGKVVGQGFGKQYPIDIDFKEDGAGGAYWTIKK